MGSYLSVHNDTNDEWLVQIGPDQEAIRIAGWAAFAVGTAATLGGAAPVVAALGITEATAASIAAASAGMGAVS